MASPENESRACYFVVARVLGREVPALYWEELPRAPIRNLTYVVRLDQLPNAEALGLCNANLWELFRVYQHMKARGKLPPRWEPPPRPKTDDGTKIMVGHRENLRRGIDTPYDPHA